MENLENNERYDAVLFGIWYGGNYGSVLTNFALYKLLSEMGYNCIFADMPDHLWPKSKIHRDPLFVSRRFCNKHFVITEKYTDRTDLKKLNELSDTFILGSDQLWNYKTFKSSETFFFLDFADSNKRKIAYATSFGQPTFQGTDEEKKIAGNYLQKFTSISVREEAGVELCKKEFGVDAAKVLDPVFMCDKKYYFDCIENSNLIKNPPEESYLLAYILDPNESKQKAIEYAAEKLGLKLICIPNANVKEKMRQNWRLPIKENLDVEDWLYYFRNAEMVITDSFHGSCFSIIFERPFISILNRGRGTDRFYSLLKDFSLLDHLVETPDDIMNNETLFDQKIDYSYVHKIIQHQREQSLEWFKNALTKEINADVYSDYDILDRRIDNVVKLIDDKEKALLAKIDEQNKTIEKYKKEILKMQENNKKPETVGLISVAEETVSHPALEYTAESSSSSSDLHPDIQRCQMVAALLRDYGVDHVVLSSGSRHAQLCRFFEHNKCFITHNVVDERSAGFFALGLAAKLRKPVALCCTSGTAASNYLTSLSEAFYQHIPLICITADRYPYFLNQREEQMVPQVNIYGSIVLKSVTLPIADDTRNCAVTRKLICETILEATHRTPGPVHINVPIKYRKKLDKAAYSLDNVKYEKIERYMLTPERKPWRPALSVLSSSSKIMIVYGQNKKLTDDEQRTLNDFVEKFNCVVCTEHLSNVNCIKSVDVFNILKDDKKQSQLRKKLLPDIVITVYGSNASKMLRFVRGFQNIEHWDVTPSGEAADPYHQLSRIFECTPDKFFKRCAVMTETVQADDSYYKLWKELEVLDDEIPEQYCQKYAVSRIISKIPAGSLLHLGNSNTVRMACAYSLDKSVEVYCNRGTNGIDGSASAFMGQVAVSDELCFLMIGDLSFFYDMNSLWNKKLKGNIRIVLFNNFGAGLLRDHGSKAITYSHDDTAEGWVKSLGFTYLSSKTKEEFDANIDRFTSNENIPMFFEVFTN